MEMQNNLLDENVQNPIDSPQLSYMLNVEKVGNLVSKTTDNSSQNRTQCVWNEVLALKNTPKPQGESVDINSTNTCSLQDIINIQLPYNVNQMTEQDSWYAWTSFIRLQEHQKVFVSHDKLHWKQENWTKQG